MKKTTAIKKFLATGKLSTDLLKPLGISFESFLKLAQLPKERADEIEAKLKARYEVELPRLLEAEKAARKAKKALAEGDIDAAFDYGMKAAELE